MGLAQDIILAMSLPIFISPCRIHLDTFWSLVSSPKGKRKGDLKPRLDGRQEWVRIKMGKNMERQNYRYSHKKEEEKGRFDAGQRNGCGLRWDRLAVFFKYGQNCISPDQSVTFVLMLIRSIQTNIQIFLCQKMIQIWYLYLFDPTGFAGGQELGTDKDGIGKNITKQKYKIQIHPQKGEEEERFEVVGWMVYRNGCRLRWDRQK